MMRPKLVVSFLLLSMGLAFPAVAETRIKILTDDGIERWAPVSEVLPGTLPVEPPTDPDPDSAIVFEDTFTSLSIEDAWQPTTGATWIDGWSLWRVRHLQGNQDLGWKVHLPGQTHEIVEGGLALRGVNVETEPGFPYTAGMLSTERSFSFGPGHRIDVELRVTSLSPGGHFSLWLLEADSGRWPPEIDLLEVIGSNSHFPDGPVDLYSVNGLRPDGGGPGIQFFDHDRDFWDEFHTFSFIWTEDMLIWKVDGNEVRRQPNFLTAPMFFLATWELGASGNGDFPGPVNEATVWPMEVILKRVAVTRID